MSLKSPNVLIVDDDRVIREALSSALEEAGYTSRAVAGIQPALAALRTEKFDALLLDIRLKDGNGLEFLEIVRRDVPQLPVIMATAYGDSERTISAMKSGAFDYVTKPFDLDGLLAVIAKAVRVHPPAKSVVEVPDDVRLVGSSPAMLDVWKMIGRAATSRAPVLITGESGVGKELVARAIHDHSGQRTGPFVAVNLAALPAALIESELFGHEKGAFTGATTKRVGRFELASDGTLFLDEVGDLDIGLQTKLLRVLEDGTFERVGDGTKLRTNARILAATSRTVTPGAEGGALREDLYYRLGVVRIHVPPLRERMQDIPLLVDAFLRSFSGPRRAISEEAMERLLAYEWPGNVRQLRHALENASIMSTAEVLDPSDFALPEIQARVVANSPDEESPLPTNLDLRQNLERLERQLIETALAQARGNRALAARLLGIRRALLYARMKHLGLE